MYFVYAFNILSRAHRAKKQRKRKLDCCLVPAAQQLISGVKGRAPAKPDRLVQDSQTWKYSCSELEGVEHVRTQGREGARRWEAAAAAHHSPIPKQLNTSLLPWSWFCVI